MEEDRSIAPVLAPGGPGFGETADDRRGRVVEGDGCNTTGGALEIPKRASRQGYGLDVRPDQMQEMTWPQKYEAFYCATNAPPSIRGENSHKHYPIRWM